MNKTQGEVLRILAEKEKANRKYAAERGFLWRKELADELLTAICILKEEWGFEK